MSRERKPTWMHWWDVTFSDVVILFAFIWPKVNFYMSHMIIQSETTKVSFSLKHFCCVQMSLNRVPFFKFCQLQSTNRMNTKVNTSVSCDILISGCSCLYFSHQRSTLQVTEWTKQRYNSEFVMFFPQTCLWAVTSSLIVILFAFKSPISFAE